LLTEIDETLERSISPKPAPAPAMAPHLSAAIPEKVYGRGNLQSVAWLARGVEAGKSVCRIITPTSLGTGFITPNGRIITNNHVVPDKETAAKTRIEFNFERDGDGNLQPSKMYHASDLDFFTLPEPWDCTVMNIADPCDNMGQWGTLSPSDRETPVLGDPVTIIQHPNGGEKQIAVTANEVIAISQGKLAYLTDTLGGSSGSPVFNERWEVVALHRAGGALVPTQDGATLRANEGVLFSGLFTLPEFRNALGRSI
jgi:V8-like Glu-specific endopeptidase